MDAKKERKNSFFHELLHPQKTVVFRTRGGIDKTFLIIVLMLVAFGSVMIFSAGYVYAAKRFDDSFYFVKRQFIYAVIGVAVMILLANIDYTVMKRFALPVYIVSMILLVLVLIPGVGVTAKGATLKEARAKAYEATKWVDFENKYMRTDIGKAIDEA